MPLNDHCRRGHQESAYVRRHFLKVATEVATTIGMDFLYTLAGNLAQELEADSVYIGEFVGGPVQRVRTLAVCVDDHATENFEFPLSGSPEKEVAAGHPCIFLKGLQETFPADLRLSELKVEACVVLPLNHSESPGPGLIAAFYRRPLRKVQLAQSMLAMFVPRVLAEVRRKQAEDELRESEQRYRAFVTVNPDPMWRIEFTEPVSTDLPEDQQLENIIEHGYIAECNEAVARLLGTEKEQLLGRRLKGLASLFRCESRSLSADSR